ncbi:DUF498-domain-containing protein [Coniophora puteana RWD-64-598 SS2]|uniref:NADH dehydrogenase [ubiquinone] 1 alpha subcomplex assembly factor 3 n=1 Tax=Coniophora puteana (strain RWD-64-598) TaxID=741705 RepID=A0A5M3MC26_CONPW|nr:DUF498-domain-containing protein [Coniophora puteana RWD-64-598 SS2]EIW76195.1 DUF498-domain-containing protein [Coniophora puteana RWD-64-598 SS2]
MSTPRSNRAQGLTNMLASEVPPPVQVLSVGSGGISLADGLVLRGPAVFLEGRVWLWDVPVSKSRTGEASWEGWDQDCFKLFEVVVPRPEILIVGTGEKMSLFPPVLRKYLNGLGIQVDAMDTRNACSTYNLLAEEGRHVAAAVLPPNPAAWRRSQ